MDVLLPALTQTIHLVWRMGSVMFVCLFGVELLMQLGAMKYLRPVGRPVARLAHLPSESALSLLTAIGSMIAAHTMAAQYRQDGNLTRRELIATGVLVTVPFHFRETFTYQLPVVLPLLGTKLCLIYITAFWLTGVIKIAFVLVYGRLCIRLRPSATDAFDALTCDPDKEDCIRRTWKQLLRDTWQARRPMFVQMILVLGGRDPCRAGVGQFRRHGLFQRLILPLTALLDLPAAVVGPITAHVFSPTTGIAFMSNLMQNRLVTDYRAIVALLAAGMRFILTGRMGRDTCLVYK